MLTNEEKANIVSQHIKNIEINEYNLGLSLIEANSKAVIDQSSVDLLDAQIADLSAQKTALQAELTSLQA
jgi:hypothetical protein